MHNITVQHSGSVHDATVLKCSALFQDMEQYERPTRVINGEQIAAFMIGDPADPMQTWLLKNYASPRDAEESFNVYLNKGRVVVKNVIGRLKSRFRMIQKRIDADISMVPSIVATCCVLNNIAEKRKLPVRENWIAQTRESECLYPQPVHPQQFQGRLEAVTIRDQMKNYMAENLPLLSSNGHF